ncbi:protein kinase [Stutzerimonas chloritidismutans]|uniref:phosphotransferase family protein n=1 Tax=Stutzerimonas chloritidismutans TaxID=203192 RepID=UPI003F19079D
MPFLFPWPRDFLVTRDKGCSFYFLPDAAECLNRTKAYIFENEIYPALDVVEEGRAVYLLSREGAVLKYNRIRHWKSRLRKSFAFLNAKGKYCLLDEFNNLSKLSGSDLVPQVYGYGYRRALGLLKHEYLVLEYFDGSVSVDDALRSKGETPEIILPRVFELFKNMLNQGFVHMDPHPKNIMIMPAGALKLIDFECCAFDVVDRSFCLAFCLGYFYHFWFFQFMQEQQYDQFVFQFIDTSEVILEGDFWLLYNHFKRHKVSRSLRYQCFLSVSARKEFLARCLRIVRDDSRC